MKIKKGDTVKVLYGKDAGRSGKVMKILPREMMVVVEGLNMFKKHVKGDGQSKSSEIVTISKPLPLSKVMLIDPSDNKPTRVKYDVKSKGEKSRVSVRTNKSIDATEAATEKKVTKKKSKSTKK